MDIYLLPQKRSGHMLFSGDFADDAPENAPEETPEAEEEEAAAEAEEGEKVKFRTRLWAVLKAGYRAATRERRRVEQMLHDAGDMPIIRLHYPDHLSESEAREIYRQLIEEQVRKHKRWMLVDGALLPLGALFTIVPGPNLLLAYLAWRTLSHYKLHKKGRKVLDDNGIRYIGEPKLRELTHLLRKRFCWNRKGKIRRIGQALDLEHLERLY